MPNRRANVLAVNSLLRHRGPDGEGHFDDGDCTLAMRRLAVIDLVGGHQPIHNEAGDVVCVCNGELYNYQTLADGLHRAGHTFASASDVEVAVHGYEDWGEEVVNKLNGMFSLAIWDARRRRLLLARDRMGKKPLYFARLGEGLVFASELRSILAYPGATWTVDPVACRAFCALGYMPGDRTPIAEVRKLPPGYIGAWNSGEFQVSQYWAPERVVVPESERLAVEALWELLKDAVRLRLISDVPLGAFLSGGLDSSVVVGVAARELGAKVPTFSITFPGYSHHDEARQARLVARHFDCEHNEIPVKAANFEGAEELVWLLDEPLADPAALPTLLLSREARKDVTVVLTGEGADEVFGGYDRYRLALWGAATEKRLPFLGALAGAVLQWRSAHKNDDSWASRILRATVQGREDPTEWSHSLSVAAAVPCAIEWDIPNLDGFISQSPVRTLKDRRLVPVQLSDIRNSLANGLLTKVDRITMSASLEARCPYLDYRVVTYGLSLPDQWKMRGLTSKLLLRTAAKRLLPPSILNRPKHTFRVPLGEWLRGPLRKGALEAARSQQLARLQILPKGGMERLAQDHVAGRADYSRALWAIITLHLWLSRAMRQFTLSVPEPIVDA